MASLLAMGPRAAASEPTAAPSWCAPELESLPGEVCFALPAKGEPDELIIFLHGVIAPFCSGCGAIISYPLAERESENPRAVIGMFDVSARPFVKENILSFAMPMKKLSRMLDDMDESFLITGSWEKVARRIEKKG